MADRQFAAFSEGSFRTFEESVVKAQWWAIIEPT